MTIGEAVAPRPSGLRDAHPEVTWSDIARMRDACARGAGNRQFLVGFCSLFEQNPTRSR